MITREIIQYLDDKGVEWHPKAHPPRVTAQQIAAAGHVTGKRFAKTVVLETGKPGWSSGLVLAALPADREVDLERLGNLLGTTVRLAEEESFASRFPGCELGAMPPLGELWGMAVLVDQALAHQRSIVFNGGTHEDTIEMAWRDYERIAALRVMDFGRPVASAKRAA